MYVHWYSKNRRTTLVEGKFMKKAWFRGALFLSTICPFALIGGQSSAQAQSLSLSTTPETEAPGSSSEELGEIVVTAQHRSENIQVVPISVTAISPSQIRDQGMILMQDVQLVSPGLTFVVNSIFSAPYIRGI